MFYYYPKTGEILRYHAFGMGNAYQFETENDMFLYINTDEMVRYTIIPDRTQ